MAVNLVPPEALLPVPGVRLGSANAGIKQKVRDDLVVLTLPEGSTAGAVFTQSRFRAAPVIVAAEALARAAPRALVINSGNANAATGEPGLEDARAICREVSRHLNIEPASVLPFSTGVIGTRLPVEAINAAVARLARDCESDDLMRAARAIMTTDTVPKGVSRTVALGSTTVTITGIAKGAGMIKPDMATMLAYVMTDARIERDVLQRLTARSADASFNRITVDGDTSTNDSFVVCATNLADHDPITGETHPHYAPFAAAIVEVSRLLAQAIVRDAEGATKFVTVRVRGGRNQRECLAVAYTVAESPLIKTALFAGDPNWGRFCMAIGRAGIDDLDPALVDLDFDDVAVARGGLLAQGYREPDAARVLAQPEFTVTINLGRGGAEDTVWTCDFSYDYVKINAEYRS